MSSRERVLAAVNFREPDRVPIDFGGMRSTGISAFAYADLKRHLGITSGAVRVYDSGQVLAQVEPVLLERFEVDVVPLEPASYCSACRTGRWKQWAPKPGYEFEVPDDFNPKPDGEGGWNLMDGDRVYARMPAQGWYFDGVPRNTPRARPALSEYRPYIVSDDDLEFMAAESRRLEAETDYAVLAMGIVGAFFNLELGGFENWMMALVEDRAYVHDALAITVDASIEDTRRFHQAVGDRVLALVAADDMGTQRGPYVSREMFDEIFAPHLKRYCTWLHENTPYRLFLHCCGAVYPLIETFIACGVDILNPVQTSAAEMEPERLKAEFGGRIVFWGGGCDTQRVLPFGTAEEVREMVRERIQIFAPGGGFVFNQIHNIQYGVPPENVVAMFEAAQEFGRYPVETWVLDLQ